MHGDGQDDAKRERNHARHEINERVGHVQNIRQFSPPNVARHICRLIQRSRHIVDEQNDTSHAMLRDTEAKADKENLHKMVNQNREFFVLWHSRSPTKQQEERRTDILRKLKVIHSLQPDTEHQRRAKGRAERKVSVSGFKWGISGAFCYKMHAKLGIKENFGGMERLANRGNGKQGWEI